MFTTLLIISLGIFVPSYIGSTRDSSASTSSNVALTISASPPILPSDGGSYSALVLEFKYLGTNLPYVPQSDIVVYLTSSDLQVGNVPSSVTFPAGSLYLPVSFSTTSTPGTATISAAAAGYQLATTQLSTTNMTNLIATTLAIYATPNTLLANGQQFNNVVVQLQNPNGVPQKTDSAVSVQLVSQNASVGAITSVVTIQPGSTFASATFTTTNETGTVSVVAVASGYLSAQTKITSVLMPITVQASLSTTNVPSNGQVKITILVTSDNVPISGASVTWSVISGIISNGASSTDQTGSASATYTAGPLVGSFTIRATVSDSGYLTSSSGTLVTVTGPSTTQKSGGFMTMNIMFIPLWILIVVAAAAAGTFGIFFIRKRRAEEEYQEEEEV